LNNPLFQIFYLFQLKNRKHSIEFELQNFSKEFNQNRETAAIFRSVAQKFGEFNWALGAQARKNPILKQNEYFLEPYLYCECADQSKFPVFTYLNTSVLNQEKDFRKSFSRKG